MNEEINQHVHLGCAHKCTRRKEDLSVMASLSFCYPFCQGSRKLSFPNSLRRYTLCCIWKGIQ